MIDVVALGESLIDLTETGENELGIKLMARNPGGAPANCLAMNTKLGGKTAMIGMVGDDVFGHYLAKNMEDAGIGTEGLLFSKEYPTTLAVVSLDESGERSFAFYRAPSADMMLDWEKVNRKLIDECSIFHFGGVSLSAGPCADATLKAAEYAKKLGKTVSYDPNYRDKIWKDPVRAKKVLAGAIPLCDILKVNEEELELLADTNDPVKGAEILKAMGPSVVLVTLGKDGAYFLNNAGSGKINGFRVNAVDTTGAGDSFTGAFHYFIKGMNKGELAGLDPVKLTEIVTRACAAGALTTVKYGAIPALPEMEEILSLMGSCS